MKYCIILITLIATVILSGCSDDADIASDNLSKAADNFEVVRRVVFYNGITGEYILVVQGLCSVEKDLKTVSFICKNGEGKYVKHMLGLSDNVTYFSEQLVNVDVSVHNYRVTFKPDTILPDINIRSQLIENNDNVRIGKK
ncbi:hypothetical protein TSMG0096 [Halocynthia phage JM-2012]|uniref:site-specific recombination directionality factor RDF n=1 Tax=Halocynthia phage JM-2012 TaxID=1173297 RepID=UPI00025C6934|nr:site-specific recombination directionality factor RDF [Halocynthia phage JM-2012]AFI55379.1 hypothetical protein TSMG0096 [Halocynthia phage JM-2012]